MYYPGPKYNIRPKKWEQVVMILVFALVIGMVCLNLFVKKEVEPDLVVPMANSRIEWSGAGYNGINGRD